MLPKQTDATNSSGVITKLRDFLGLEGNIRARAPRHSTRRTTSQLAGAIGPSIGGLFVLYYPFLTFPRYIFYASILAQIPSIVLFALFVKETLKKDVNPTT